VDIGEGADCDGFISGFYFCTWMANAYIIFLRNSPSNYHFVSKAYIPPFSMAQHIYLSRAIINPEHHLIWFNFYSYQYIALIVTGGQKYCIFGFICPGGTGVGVGIENGADNARDREFPPDIGVMSHLSVKSG